jgi:menaquinone-dependent protoporphyrinogen IX oxidase
VGGDGSGGKDGVRNRIEYVHASKYGNGAKVAAEFEKQMAAKGAKVNVHHVRQVSVKALPAADLYVFSSPGRMGRPLCAVRRFLKQLALPPGTPYAILTTEAAPRPDKKTGRMPTEEEIARWQHVRPFMKQVLDGKGLVEVSRTRCS